jgi:hypothetical protein
MLNMSTIRQKVGNRSNWGLKRTFVALVLLTALLTLGSQVRATTSPLVLLGQNSTIYGPISTLICSPTNGGDVQVTSDTVALASGHTYFFQPAIFSGGFNVSSATNPTYTVEFYVNGSAYGSITGFTAKSGLPITASFAEPMSTFTIYQFFNSGQAGPQHLVWTIDIHTTSGQSVCVQQWYLTLTFGYA